MGTTTEQHDDGCQHCHRPVRWGRTEQGFAGFVHADTGLAACPTEDDER